MPAIVISPLIPKNTIDHRLYDHASIPAMIKAVFGAGPLTARDGQANSPDQLLSLQTARQDTPTTLPSRCRGSGTACDEHGGPRLEYGGGEPAG